MEKQVIILVALSLLMMICGALAVTPKRHHIVMPATDDIVYNEVEINSTIFD